MKTIENKEDENPWEERADDISDEVLLEWTAQTEEFKKLVRLVERPGAVLFEGPRGTGKTHLLRYAYNDCIHNRKKPLPIYVSYGKYYHLEPLLTRKANARKIFHTWVLCKLVLGLEDTIKKISLDDAPSLWLGEDKLNDIRKFKNIVEKGDYHADDISERILREINIDNVISIINDSIRFFKRNRAILLLDDAALSLTPEYLTEFFDVFRSLKSKSITPKGTVYPGSTDYGPRFHIGQDAKREPVWKIDSNGNNNLLLEIANERLQDYIVDIPNDILPLLVKASFGIPRTFINMINSYREKDGSQQVRFNHVIDNQVNFLLTEYRTLKRKMPTFSTIIDVGEKLFENIIKLLTESNLRLSSKDEKQILIGFDKDSIKEKFRERMIQLLIEAGLLYPSGDIRHGQNRLYARYIPHLSFLIKERAFSKKVRGLNAKDIHAVMERKNTKHPERVSFQTILDKDLLGKINLDLPPCTKCNEKRLTETQNFCHKCGNELVNESRFSKCMSISLSEVPSIPMYLKDKIETETDLDTIGDILGINQPASELRKAKGIGAKKSEKIYDDVIDYVKEFLS